MNNPLDIDGFSQSTRRNWKKVQTRSSERVTARANKRRSQKRIVSYECFRDKKNAAIVRRFLDFVVGDDWPIDAALLSLDVNLLQTARIDEKAHVANALRGYRAFPSFPLS